MGFVDEQKCKNFEKRTLAVVEQKLAVVEPVETTHPYRIFLKLKKKEINNGITRMQECMRKLRLL